MDGVGETLRTTVGERPRMRRSTALAMLLIGAAIAIGAFRDFVFVNLNYHLDFLEHARRISYAHSLFRTWVGEIDAHGLRLLKWLFALCFILCNLALAIGLSRVRFGDHRYRAPIAIGFGLVALIAGVSNVLGAWLPIFSVLGVKLLHLLQYPVVLLLIWAAGWLVPQRDGTSELP